MMLDRRKIGCWTRSGAIVLAVIFVGSFLFLGIGTDINYSILDLLRGSEEQKEQKTGSGEQIAQAEKALEEDPEDLRAIKRLSALYLQEGQTDRAAEVLEKGRRVDPEDPVIPLYLGQAYEQAGEKSKAIQYWNEYLRLEPQGEQADAVKERIGALLKGEETAGGAEGAKRQ